MSDSYTEVTHESWFSRIKGAVGGMLVGLLLFLAAFPLLFWNEGNSVKTYKALKEGAGSVVSVASDKVDNANEGKLVHITATAKSNKTLQDKKFGVEVPNGIRLERHVEVYQNKETKSTKTEKNTGGSTTKVTTYKYSQEWSSKLINSENFTPTKKNPNPSKEYRNPSKKMYKDRTFKASTVNAGAFTLDTLLINKIVGGSSILPKVAPKLPSKRDVSISGNYVYISNNPSSPKVGDHRISFTVVKPQEVSIAAAQMGSTLTPYKSKKVKNKTIGLVQTGKVEANMMFEKAQADNKTMTWILRFVGILIMFIGLNMIMKPLSVVADILPIAGNIVGAGTFLIALLLTIPLSSLTIAIAWIVYRPVLGVLLLAVAIGGGIALGKKLKEGKEKSAGAGNSAGKPAEEVLAAPDIDLG